MSNISLLPPLKPYCFSPIIPLIYDESLSYYQALMKLTEKINEIINQETDYSGSIAELGEQVNQLTQATKESIQKLTTELTSQGDTLQGITEGKYTEMYINSLSKWIDDNLENIVAGVCKFVQFGISDEGRFMAYIPNNWSFLKFSTVVDPTSELYGHLVLSWEAPA